MGALLIACINVLDERLVRIREREANAVNERVLQIREGFLLRSRPGPWLVFMQQACHWLGNVLNTRHKALVKATKSKETTDVF